MFPTGLFPDDWLRLAVSFRHTWPIHVACRLELHASWVVTEPGLACTYASLKYFWYAHGLSLARCVFVFFWLESNGRVVNTWAVGRWASKPIPRAYPVLDA